MPLCKKSSIIQRRLNVNDELQGNLEKVLKEIGLTLTDCPLLVFNCLQGTEHTGKTFVAATHVAIVT